MNDVQTKDANNCKQQTKHMFWREFKGAFRKYVKNEFINEKLNFNDNYD